jgi:UDP-N-acetyl-D-mannosaminuronate dehydrogenase
LNTFLKKKYIIRFLIFIKIKEVVMKIGFIGLGNVGGKLAGSLLRNKFDLTVKDLDSKLTKDFADKGAGVITSAKELAEKVDLIITCLPSPKICAEVMEGENGVIKGISNRIDLVDFVQKGRYLCIYQKGTDGLQGKIKGTGPWYTYTTQEWSNADQRFIKLPEKITHTWTADAVRKFYNERMKESWVMSHACDF